MGQWGDSEIRIGKARFLRHYTTKDVFGPIQTGDPITYVMIDDGGNPEAAEAALADLREGKTAAICERCGQPIGYKVLAYNIEGGEDLVSDGYFEGGSDGGPRCWFHHQCEDMKPLKRHLLPWVSAFAPTLPPTPAPSGS